MKKKSQMGRILFEEEKYGETTLEINWSSVQKNINYFKEKLPPNTFIMLMLKASAYGMGVRGISKLIEKNRLANYFGVANIDEGIELRKAGIELPIMVQNPNNSHWEILVKNCLEPEIHNLELLISFKSFLSAKSDLAERNYPIHLKFNTGMNRLGIETKDIGLLKKEFLGTKSLNVKSIMTHLSSAGNIKDDEFTKNQFDEFDLILEKLKDLIHDSTIIHALNSEGVERHTKFHYKMARIGIGIYGNSAEKGLKKSLIPATKLKTKVISTRRVEKGGSISYSRSGRVDKDSNIAVLSIGYADGFPIKLGNGNWKVEINGKLYPTIGVVCMDLCMVNLGNDNVSLGDDAIIWGGINSIFDYAKAIETIPYQCMTAVSERVKKVIFSD